MRYFFQAMQTLITVVFLLTAVWIMLGDYSDDRLKWAIGALALLAGYWLRDPPKRKTKGRWF